MKNTIKFLIILLCFILCLGLIVKFRGGSDLKILFASIFDYQENDIESDSNVEFDTESLTFGNEIETEIQTEEVDFTTLSYIAIGDSITFGCSIAHPTQYENGGYPNLVKENLSLNCVTNHGVPGNQVDAMISRLSTMSADADIVSFMGGINDFNNDVPLGDINDNTLGTFYGRLNLLSQALTEKYPDAFIFYMTPFPSAIEKFNTPNFEGYTLEDFAIAVKEVANKFNISVLDMYNQSNYELEMYNPDSDGVHPSQEFFEEYTAPQIAEFIRQNYICK